MELTNPIWKHQARKVYKDNPSISNKAFCIILFISFAVLCGVLIYCRLRK